MLKKRNAQGISIHVIIVAVIALIVLIVLIGMFTGKFGEFGKGIESFGNPLETCEEQGGGIVEVENLEEGDCPSGKVQLTSSDSIAKGNKCCKFVVTPADDRERICEITLNTEREDCFQDSSLQGEDITNCLNVAYEKYVECPK